MAVPDLDIPGRPPRGATMRLRGNYIIRPRLSLFLRSIAALNFSLVSSENVCLARASESFLRCSCDFGFPVSATLILLFISARLGCAVRIALIFAANPAGCGLPLPALPIAVLCSGLSFLPVCAIEIFLLVSSLSGPESPPSVQLSNSAPIALSAEIVHISSWLSPSQSCMYRGSLPRLLHHLYSGSFLSRIELYLCSARRDLE